MFQSTYVVDVGQNDTKVVTTAHMVWVMLDDWTLAGQFVLVRAVWNGLALEGDERFASLAQQLNGTKFVGTESEALALASGDHLLAILQHQFTVGRHGQKAIALAFLFQQQGIVLGHVAQSEITISAVDMVVVMNLMMAVMAMMAVVAMMAMMTMMAVMIVMTVIIVTVVMIMATVMTVLTMTIVVTGQS
jgi:hypothetical protein